MSNGANEPVEVRLKRLEMEAKKEKFWRWIIGPTFVTLLIVLGVSIAGLFSCEDIETRQWCQGTATFIIGTIVGFFGAMYSKKGQVAS